MTNKTTMREQESKARGIPYSNIKGVGYRATELRSSKPWRVRGKDQVHLGSFETQEEAERVKLKYDHTQEIREIPTNRLELKRLKKQLDDLNNKFNRILGKFAVRCNLVEPKEEDWT